MWSAIRRCGLGVCAILLSSLILLFSDVEHRRRGVVPHVAILQHASQALLDDGVKGILDAITDTGFVDGKNIVLRRFNAENDLATANAIAKEITNGSYDMVITVSTLSLQVVANANRSGKAIHVFGIVADPSVAGVGVSRENPLAHPRHLVGIGSALPVEPAFQLAKELNPNLRTVGVAWNAVEPNSEMFTKRARGSCRDLGITLLEANVENSSSVLEAALSLVSRGAQALWVGGDVTVMVAIDSVISAARKGRIPVFSIVPPAVMHGALFDYGADFYAVGRDTGALAVRILRGADPAKIPVRNYVPVRILVNTTAVRGLRHHWRIPPQVLARADVVVDETGVHERGGQLRVAARRTAAGGDR
jgi:ABC-type uncharacterized transport system substrate-binding protein